MRRLLVLAVFAAAVGAGCTDAEDPPSAEGATATSQPAPITIEAIEACGPTDSSAVRVDVEGVSAASLKAELVLNGESVAVSDPVNTGPDSLLIEAPLDTTQTEVITVLDITGASVRARPLDGGAVVAVDRSVEGRLIDCG
jgi:hypothetical protein